jgi:RNA 3'-terminal phosphate cyclase (ATP)
MVEIDGSFGEGGGQILRTALALSLVTGQPFRINNIRAGRKKPGLLRQHLTAVQAATEIGSAQVSGASMGSREVNFAPSGIRSGRFTFSIGTAGSTTLVLQTVLPALIVADGPSTLVLEGGTHNPFAPPFDFLATAFLPLLKRMGAEVRATIERPGFYPAGGGRLKFDIIPAGKLGRLELPERGEIRRRAGRALIANLPANIADRELNVIRRKMSWGAELLHRESMENSAGPGNIVIIEIESEHVTEVFTGFGERGLPAESVAEQAVKAARRYLAAEVSVGEYLADQLLLPMAIGGGGTFSTLPLSRHATTNMEVIHRFLGRELVSASRNEGRVQVEVGFAAILRATS